MVSNWALSLVLAVMAVGGGDVVGAAGAFDLAQEFTNPPLSVRPSVYWSWVNGLTDKRRMTRELEELKAKGIGGLYIFDIGAQDPQKIVPAGPAFMGPESVDAIGHTVREATRLGLEVGLVTSSSWNCGGPWVPPEYASMGLYHCRRVVTGPTRLSEVLPMPELPKNAPRSPDGRAAFVRDVAILALPGEGKVVKDPNRIINLTGQVDESGRLDWDVPAGEWTILRFVCANTGLALRLPSPNSGGLAIDHFNPAATRFHFEYLLGRLHKELGDFRGTALKQLYVCSYELSGSTWTPDFLAEFEFWRGYDMTKYLPVLAGWVVGSREITDRFDYDYRKTLGDLLVHAFYETATEISNKHGLQLCAEAGGPGPPLHQVPVSALDALGAVDIPRGEFWKDHDVWVVKETACASHIYGKRIVDMEAFTSWRHWQDGPFELKPIADRAFCDGANHMTFHTSAHNPSATDRPGWVYHAGTHIGPSIAWWPMAGAWIDYLSRCSYLLQQGLFVADVCYYYGDHGFNFVPPKHVDPSLGYGYDYDVVNADAICSRMEVRDGRITLLDGLGYELLVLPDRVDISPQVLGWIEQLVLAGATVVGRKPTRSNGLEDYSRQDGEVREIADRLWGPCDGDRCKERAYGRGKIVWGTPLRQLLHAKGLGPDFISGGDANESDLDYIHRRTPDADIYFISNRTDCRLEPVCTFRVTGRTPELWMPDTGEIRRCQAWESVDGGTRVSLSLAPHDSVFVVFHDSVQNSQTTARAQTVTEAHPVAGPWRVHFPEGWGAPASKVFPELVSWTEDSDWGVKHFSGVAAYQNHFKLPSGPLAAGDVLQLDLGRVRFVAEVLVNGHSVGVLWKPPFRVDITDAVRPGTNELIVKVANTWSNRLVGDALSEGRDFCRTNIAKSLTWQTPWKETPLLESGLLGPVTLTSVRR
ncbi:MAG: glycosyl hydrolase [Phycisphaerales bacterium]